MDGERIDGLARLLAVGLPRRRLVAGLIAGMLTPAALRPPTVAAACKKVGKSCDKNKDCCDHAECPASKCRCKEGFKNCDGKCFNLDNDEKHCGRCDFVCRTNENCCDGDCVDRDGDPNNCGSCGTQCDETEECVGGDCVVPPGGCAPGSDLCTGAGTALCPDNPECICSPTTEGATTCGLPLFDAVCGECVSSADCAFRGTDAFCVKSVLPCCGPDAQNVCRVPCPLDPN
ncbi:MAG: hypothetical protein H0V24_02895 [Chloroflexia bacterium]|nr:hypothetical protein [Chloroflexia bacterium]